MDQLTKKQDEIYKKLMNQYQHQYRVFTQEDGVREIRLKHGSICSNNGDGTILLAFLQYETTQKANSRLRTLQTLCPEGQVTQRGDNVFGFKFPKEYLDALGPTLEIRKKRQLSPKEQARLAKYHFIKRLQAQQPRHESPQNA